MTIFILKWMLVQVLVDFCLLVLCSSPVQKKRVLTFSLHVCHRKYVYLPVNMKWYVYFSFINEHHVDLCVWIKPLSTPLCVIACSSQVVKPVPSGAQHFCFTPAQSEMFLILKCLPRSYLLSGHRSLLRTLLPLLSIARKTRNGHLFWRPLVFPLNLRFSRLL